MMRTATASRGTVGGVTTVYIAGLYEYRMARPPSTMKAVRCGTRGYARNNGVFYALSDHLRGTSVLVNQNGTVNSRNYYYPYGGNRGGSAFSDLTTKRFTGQYHEQGLPGGEGLAYPPPLFAGYTAKMSDTPFCHNPRSMI